jgi:hypothetical protein
MFLRAPGNREDDEQKSYGHDLHKQAADGKTNMVKIIWPAAEKIE